MWTSRTSWASTASDTAVTGNQNAARQLHGVPEVAGVPSTQRLHAPQPATRTLGTSSYFFAYRQAIDDIAGEISLRPESWENYRPLWYTRFGDEPLRCLRI